MADKQLMTRPKAEVGHVSGQYGRPAGALDSNEAKREIFSLTDRDLYRPAGAGGKRAPSAKLIKHWGHKKRLSCEETICEKTKEHAKVGVKAYGPDKIEVREVIVILRYEDMLRSAILSAITDGVSITFKDGDNKKFLKISPDQIKWDIGPDGPVIDTSTSHGKNALLAIYNAHVQKVSYSERTARTAAQKIAFMELMGVDEDDDIPAMDVGDIENLATESTHEEQVERTSDLSDARGRVVAACMELANGNKEEARGVFLIAVKKLNLNYAASKDIVSVKDAEAIIKELELAKVDIANKKNGNIPTEDVRDNGVGEVADDLDNKKNVLLMNITQILDTKAGSKKYGNAQAIITAACKDAGIDNPSGDLDIIKTEEQIEGVTQALIDIMIGTYGN